MYVLTHEHDVMEIGDDDGDGDGDGDGACVARVTPFKRFCIKSQGYSTNVRTVTVCIYEEFEVDEIRD